MFGYNTLLVYILISLKSVLRYEFFNINLFHSVHSYQLVYNNGPSIAQNFYSHGYFILINRLCT